MYLLSVQDLMPFYKEYKYIHIGLVQIALKPLTLLGQNTSIQCTLRDGRCTNWRASLMGAMAQYILIYTQISVLLYLIKTYQKF